MRNTSYTPAQFDQPKVKGLAIHNAKLAVGKALQAHDERKAGSSSFYVLPDEVQSYCLFIVNAHCDVTSCASAATASDFAKFTSAGNLSALASKHRAIGFVALRDGYAKKGPTYVPLPVPLRASR